MMEDKFLNSDEDIKKFFHMVFNKKPNDALLKAVEKYKKAIKEYSEKQPIKEYSEKQNDELLKIVENYKKALKNELL